MGVRERKQQQPPCTARFFDRGRRAAAFGKARAMNDAEALKKLQETELQILLAIAEFCDRNDIEWFMDSGTALGAMRHGGFIPWDDDIDIGMMRDDYDRFIELARTGLPQGYSLQTFSSNPSFPGMFAKVYKDNTAFHTKETAEAGCDQGIFVDIFAYDTLAADASQRARQLRTARLWQSVSYLYHAKTIVVPHKGALGAVERAACRAAHYVVRALARRASIEKRYDRARSFEGAASDECSILFWTAMKPCRKTDMIPPSRALFCGHELPIAARPETYLDNMYGDWRTLPAPENRRTHLPEFIDFGDGTSWRAGGDAA